MYLNNSFEHKKQSEERNGQHQKTLKMQSL